MISKQNLSSLISPDLYIDKFNPRAFLNTYHRDIAGYESEGNFMPIVHDTLFTMSKHVPAGDQMLDFGCGPSIHCTIPVVKKINKIFFADYSPKNLAEIQLWQNGNVQAHDWTETFNYYASRDGSISVSELEKQLKDKIMGYYHCDIYKDNILDGCDNQFDLIVTALCLEGVCKTDKLFTEAIQKLGDRVVPGGHVLQLAVLEETIYSFDGNTYYNLPVTQAQIKADWASAGFEVVAEKHSVVGAADKTASDFGGVLGILHRKNGA